MGAVGVSTQTGAATSYALRKGVATSYDVFLSHKSEYRSWVEWLGRALQAQGRSVFLDHWNLVPGDSWVEGLHRGLESSRSAILVATPEVVNSGWVREEYAALLRRRNAGAGFRLVPLVFGDMPNLPFLKDLQAVDCRDPAQHRAWFHRILCGLDGREPGAAPPPELAVDPPPTLTPPRAGDVAPGERGFVDRVMQRIGRPDCPPVMVVARGRRFQGPVIQAILERAREAYGAPNLWHVTPPFSEQAAPERFFAELSRQCRMERPSTDATAFTAELERRLEGNAPAFLLVTGFENGAAPCRKELAGALRTLTEQRVGSFRVVLVGGHRLMEQKYEAGILSFLTHAVVEEWPDPSVGDLLALQRLEFPALALGDDDAGRVLEATGRHAGLVRHCLERWDSEGSGADLQGWCYTCPELWETWSRLSRDLGADAARAVLARDTFGPAVAWPADAAARALFWEDLLVGRGRRLEWRAEVVRRVGREVVG